MPTCPVDRSCGRPLPVRAPWRASGARSAILAAALAVLAAPGVRAMPRTLLPAESRIEFVVKEMGVPVQGAFARFDSAIDIDPANLGASSARLKIDIGSLTTGADEADAIAVNAEWLDKQHAPFAIYRTTAIRALGGGRYEAHGLLNLRNRERDLVVLFTSADQAGGKTLITGDFVIRRTEFAIGGGEWNEGGIVAEEIPVKVRLMLAPVAARR